MNVDELGGHEEICHVNSAFKNKMHCLIVNVFTPAVYNPYSVSLTNHSRLNSAAVSLALVF